MARQQAGRFTSAQYQKLSGIDIYAASQDLKELIRKELVRLEKKGGRVYRLVEPGQAEGEQAPPEDFRSVADELTAKKRLSNSNLRRIWGGDRQSVLRRAKRLVESGWLTGKGAGRGRHYVAGPKIK